MSPQAWEFVVKLFVILLSICCFIGGLILGHIFTDRGR